MVEKMDFLNLYFCSLYGTFTGRLVHYDEQKEAELFVRSTEHLLGGMYGKMNKKGGLKKSKIGHMTFCSKIGKSSIKTISSWLQ